MRDYNTFLSLMLVFSIAPMLLSCTQPAWNSPYPPDEGVQNIQYSSFSERPKHLDPVQSYSSNEYAIHGQIYEPPLQYHYLKRPYVLEPLTAQALPQPRFVDKQGRPVAENSPQLAYSIYDITIKPGIRYQPHPAFAKNERGEYRYHALSPPELDEIGSLSDFVHRDSRELLAADYVYQIKRLAHPKLHSPILSFMHDYIVGLKEYSVTLKQAQAQNQSAYLDLTQYPLAGAEVVDAYTYRITIKGKYPQFIYWLAMPFFAPIPPEADRFYSQPGLQKRNITLDWYPVGTGAYMLTVNDPNRQMVLQRNPNYHDDYYPKDGEQGDAEQGLLVDAGKRLPFIDKVVYSLEKESIPYWNKFLQGYYDISGISSDSFDQAIQFTGQGDVQLTEKLKQQDIRLLTAVLTSISYIGFNMQDDTVGGYSPEKLKLRQAISIAIDYEEYISIFANGRGIAAQNIIPPGIFGHIEGETGVNPYVYRWHASKPQRRSVDEAKKLLAEAGYPNGRHHRTGEPLILNFDTSAGGPEDKALLDWLRKQFRKIDIQLNIRDTDYNRFQEKIRKGNAQIFRWGWNADYPDPENFLFLLYGPNAKVKHDGENASNYDNPEFNRLFDQMKNMPNSPERQAIIDKMSAIARRDAPWVWGYYPKQFVLHHSWVYNIKPNHMAHNNLKYRRMDPARRQTLRQEWNTPVVWPLLVVLGLLIMSIFPAIRTYRHKEHASAIERHKMVK